MCRTRAFRAPGRGDDNVAQLAGRALVARLDFGPLTGPLEARVAISGVNEAGRARQSRQRARQFRYGARTDSRGLGGRRWARSTSPRPRRCAERVYTALYHSLLAPSVYGDVDGRYRGPDDQVHQATGFTFHSTFSLWDTFRAEHPLLTLIQPAQRNSDFVNSLIASRPRQPVRAFFPCGSSTGARPGR